MTKKKTLLNERVLRRWGKLANMAPITENWLEEQDTPEEEEGEEEMEAGEAEMDAGEAEMGAGEASAEEEQAVERIVSAVVDAISNETGVDIEVEGEAGDDEGGADMDVDMEAGDEGGMELGDEAGMRDPMMAGNRDDDEFGIHERSGSPQPVGKRDEKGKHDRAAKRDDEEEDKHDRGDKKKNEELDLEVIDDEQLTEAVLQRVVTRLLKRQ